MTNDILTQEIIISGFILSRASFIKKIPWSSSSYCPTQSFHFHSLLLRRPAAGLSPRCSPPEPGCSCLGPGFNSTMETQLWFEAGRPSPVIITAVPSQHGSRTDGCPSVSAVLMEVTHVKSKAGRRFWPDAAHITDCTDRGSPFVLLYNWQTAHFYSGSHKFKNQRRN